MNPLPEMHYDEWFHQRHPHDDMPIATNDRFDMYGSSEADDAYNPRKPQTPAEKAKVRAHQAKVDAENAAERKKDPSQGRYPKG